jgi:PIN domain
MERLRLLLAADPSPIQERLDKLNQFVTGWLDRPDKFDFTIPATIPDAKRRFHEKFTPCLELLASLGQQTGATIVVPDTNVLVRSPDPRRYDRVLDTDDYTVVLVPPVLAELDALKTGRASPSVRDKARGVSNRIKEWRRRGSLHVGVKVEDKVSVRAEGREPKMQASLSWLDPTVVDDRIIACTLELQRRYPTDRVILLTGDVNLLAKADMAGIPTADTPDPDPE